MSQIVTSNQMASVVDAIGVFLKENLPVLLIVFGFIVGFSIILALIDDWKDERNLNRRYHL
jgi:hypothetical protein